MTLSDDIRARHVGRLIDQYEFRCAQCYESWPCDADRAADEIDAITRYAHDAYETEKARAERAEADLAAVIALCDEEEADESWGSERPWLFTTEVRAAATGDTK